MKFVGISVLLIAMLFSGISIGYSFELIEPPPDSSQALGATQSYYHLYGTEEGEFDIGEAFPTFDNVFNLYVSESVGLWDSTDIADFILLVMDSDSTNSDDVFPAVWDYFCYSDSDTTYAGVEFKIGVTTYTDIDVRLYDKDDFDCPNSRHECKSYSWYSPGTNTFTLNATSADMEPIVKIGFAHELQHLCFAANDHPAGYTSINETLATAASHLVKGYVFTTNNFDVSYDASIYRTEQCDPDLKYMVEETWVGYLIDVFYNTSNDATDDLVYNWLRYQTGGGYGEISMNSLAETLEDSDYSWLDGSTGDERLRNLFQYFSVAKFCNAPNFGSNGRFGYDGTFSPVTHLKLFLDPCGWYEEGATPRTPVDCPPNPTEHNGCWNVRILPPTYTLGSESENSMTEISGIYKDGDDTPADTTDGDKSRDYIDIATYGTDYIIFKADNYFQDNDCHELHFSLDGESAIPPTNTQVKMWIIGYDSTEDTLQLHPEDIVFIEPVYINPDSTNCYIVVTDFGRSINSVVVVISLAEETASSGTTIRYFTYEYQYGVYSPDSANVTWKGDVFMMGDVEIGTSASLTIDDGTNIRVYDDDIDATSVILWAKGELDINGSASNPVTFEPLPDDAEAGAWIGILCNTIASSASSLSYCDIAKAYHGIKTTVDIEITHCNITESEVYGIYVYNQSTYQYANGIVISYCNVNDNGAAGIYIDNADSISINNCEANGNYYGIKIEDSDYSDVETTDMKFNTADGMKIVNCDFHEFEWCHADSNEQSGMYLDADSGGTISNSSMKGNDSYGIYCEDSSCKPWIDHCKIKDSGSAGARINDSAFPVFGEQSLGIGEDNSFNNDWPRIYNNTSSTIDAENCWWGTTTILPMMFVGSVDYDPYLSSDPVTYLAPPVRKKTMLALSQNYPNPFIGATTTINYSIPNDKEIVSLRIYDVCGRRVRTLVDKIQNAGQYKINWDGRNDRGSYVSPGIYFYQLKVGDKALSRRVVLFR